MFKMLRCFAIGLIVFGANASLVGMVKTSASITICSYDPQSKKVVVLMGKCEDPVVKKLEVQNGRYSSGPLDRYTDFGGITENAESEMETAARELNEETLYGVARQLDSSKKLFYKDLYGQNSQVREQANRLIVAELKRQQAPCVVSGKYQTHTTFFLVVPFFGATVLRDTYAELKKSRKLPREAECSDFQWMSIDSLIKFHNKNINTYFVTCAFHHIGKVPLRIAYANTLRAGGKEILADIKKRLLKKKS